MDVEIRDLRKRYGALAALDGVSLSIPAGARVALVGPNGAGKSTLLRAVMGMISCEGEIKVGGLSPFRDRVRLAARLAYVPQQAPRLAAPVSEVVAAVARLRGVREDAVARAASRLGLDLAAVAAKPFRDLSGGMKQKALLALAFAAEASLYILDEPTASLDEAARESLFDLLATLPGSPTLVLCSHRPDELRRVAERVIALEDGRIARDGPVERAAHLHAPEAPAIPRPSTLRCVASAIGALVLGAAAAGCEASADAPVEPVWDRTPCARCSMLVGERTFAAQLRTEDGTVLDFDDPGCLFELERERGAKAAARWFRHVREDRWVAGDRAGFVTATPTPMGYGIGAVDAGTPGAITLEEARARCAPAAAKKAPVAGEEAPRAPAR